MTPTIYLDTIRHKTGPGRHLSAMASPEWASKGEGWCYCAAPPAPAFRAVFRGEITADAYRGALADDHQFWDDFYAPGKLFFYPPGPNGTTAPEILVEDGDVLFCACPRPGDLKRKHPFCHLEVLAPVLRRWGWRVVLYGQALDGSPVEVAPAHLFPGETHGDEEAALAKPSLKPPPLNLEDLKPSTPARPGSGLVGTPPGAMPGPLPPADVSAPAPAPARPAPLVGPQQSLFGGARP